MRVIYRRKAFLFLLFLSTFCSCKKLIEINPPVTNVTEANVYANDETAVSVLTGVYINMNKYGYFTGYSSISLLAGLSSDELSLYDGVSESDVKSYYYRNKLYVTPTSVAGTEFWSPIYNFIFVCNSAIQGLSSSKSIKPSTKQQLLGEAKFLRAFFYFYLVNLYEDVPLILGTDYTLNSSESRSPSANVYAQIITDLKDAQGLLNPAYLDANLLVNNERTRPNKSTATALLARVYLFTGNWLEAEAQATAIINNSSLYNLSKLNEVFLKNSSETIWQLQPITTGWNTEDAKTFVLPASGPNNYYGGQPVFISPTLISAFENGDQRRTSWIDSVVTSGGSKYYFPYKYKSATYGDPLTEYLVILRLSEQYLIRAEARAQLDNISGAEADLNQVRSRAGLPNNVSADKHSLLNAISSERRVELFTEWGHRWLDIKRRGDIHSLMPSICLQKGTSWSSFQQLYPLPLSDIEKDPNLKQNDGY